MTCLPTKQIIFTLQCPCTISSNATITANHNDGKSSVKDVKIALPLKYFSNFWRSLEMPLINYKTYLELNWIKDCIWSSVGDSAKFEITDDKLPFPIVTLSTKHSVNLTKK